MVSLLQWPDYLILVVFLVISLAIGVYHSLTGGKQKTTAEFIMADRRLKVIPAAISLLVSYQSAILLLGMSAEMYLYGAQFFVFVAIASAVGVFLAERLCVPWLYPLKLVSIFDFIERRFMSKSLRAFGALLAIITCIMYMGVGMYAPSAALESATGLPLTVSIPVMAVVSVTYTALGGMRAVIWTDCFQFVTMVIGLAAIFIKGLMAVGGIANVFHYAAQEGRLDLTNISPDPRERHTVWNLLWGMHLSTILGYGISQSSVQRFSAVSSLKKARAIILINIPPTIIMNSLSCLMGLIVLAYYSKIKCDPMANKDVSNANQLLPFFVLTIFADWPGIAGLFLATLYGGALSTVSSILSGCAAMCWEDILKLKLEKLSEIKKALINRFLVVLLGVFAAGIAFLSATVPGPITQVTTAFCASVAGPMQAMFIMGALTKYANWKGVFFGTVIGVALNLWLCIGSLTVPHKHPPLPPVSTEGCLALRGNSTLALYENYTSPVYFEEIGTEQWNLTTESLGGPAKHKELVGLENFYAISYMWFITFGILVTVIFTTIGSFITRDKDLEDKVDPRLLLRIRNCGWSESEETDDVEEKNAKDLENNVIDEAEINKLLSKKKQKKLENGELIKAEEALLDKTPNGKC